MKKAKLVALTMGVLAVYTAAANAEQVLDMARLTQVQGKVMINDGVRYVQAKSGAELKAGTKIITTKNSTVNVVYQNGCKTQVKESSMLTITTPAECVAMFKNERVHVADAVGSVPPTSAKKDSAWLFQDGHVIWVAAGVGGVFAAVNASRGNGHGNSPASPL